MGSNRTKKPKNRKNKVVLVFDENKRRDFLSGFHKRKLQRKKDAKEKFEKELKEERKRIKAEAKESYKKLVVSHRPIPELENLLNEEYEDEDVTVKVVELPTSDLANKNHWIGANQPKYESDKEQEISKEVQHDTEEEVPGMELKRKPKPVEKKTVESVKFKSEKDVKRALKKQATKTVKKSKVFQMKNKLEKQKQKKKALQMKKQKLKVQNKSEKGRRKKRKSDRNQ